MGEAEYKFLEQLNKNSENVGTLLDPLPSNYAGNVRCITNPSSPALGYFTIHDVKSKSLFIDYKDIEPAFGRLERSWDGCIMEELDRSKIYQLYEPYFTGAIVDEWVEGGSYYISIKECTDCKLKGGTPNKPPWWP